MLGEALFWIEELDQAQAIAWEPKKEGLGNGASKFQEVGNKVQQLSWVKKSEKNILRWTKRLPQLHLFSSQTCSALLSCKILKTNEYRTNIHVS